MKYRKASGVRVMLQDVFLSDTPLSRRPEKTPLQGETPRPDMSDRPIVKPAVSIRVNVKRKMNAIEGSSSDISHSLAYARNRDKDGGILFANFTDLYASAEAQARGWMATANQYKTCATQ